MSKIDTFLRDFVAPMLRRPKRQQVAALCTRDTDTGQQVLLVTSRGTGRWIIPKGWPIRGLDSPQAALQEAWEEAGVKGEESSASPIGTYEYQKTLNSGLPLTVETLVYPVDVNDLATDFPEAGQRERRWATPSEAANMVDEPELKTILRFLKPSKVTKPLI